MIQNSHCLVINKTKGKLPRLPFESIKNKILGKKYELEIAFLSTFQQKRLNLDYRKKNTTTNILSFPLSKNSGAITLDSIKIRQDSKLFNMSYSQFLKYLLIHGCLHLKGFKHSSTMERQEEKYLKMFL